MNKYNMCDLYNEMLCCGKEKSRFSVVDRYGVEFHCGNVVCKEKIFFVVSANGKIIECMPIEMEMYYNKGIKDMQKRQIEQLEYIRNKIENMMSIDSMLFMPLADLYNEIGLMQNHICVGKDED